MRGSIAVMDIRLSHRLVRRLRRESGGDRSILRLLTAEAVARRWLLEKGIPCWRSPEPPGSDTRYSLLFADGSRALVGIGHHPEVFDAMAKRRCQWLILISISGPGSGSPSGFLRLGEVEPGDPELLPGRLGRPRHFTRAFLLGTLRLLLSGERQPPDPLLHPRQGGPSGLAQRR